MSDIAVRVEHLSKMYRLGVINNGTLFRDIQTWIALKRGKEDPHSEIGENKYSGDKDHFWALKDVSFDIKKGDRVGIIGKNGAGKSTLLKILSRITTPTEGTIKVSGKVASLLEVGTGFNQELTGRENIYLNGAILGMKKRQIDKKLDEIIAFSGIEHHIDTPAKRYSSGMYVRLAFAVAAHLDSDILIADEVLAVGDADFQKKALGKMQDLSTGEGRTVLFVSHNMGAVRSLCTTGLVLDNGKNISNGTITDSIFHYLGMNKKTDGQFKYFFPAGKIFREVWIENFNNKITDTIKMGEAFSIVLKLFFQKEFFPELGFNFKDEYGNRVTSFSSVYQNRIRLKPITSEKIYRLKISDNIFMPGDYTLTVALHDYNEHAIEHHDDVIRLNIQENDIFFTGKTYNNRHGAFFSNVIIENY